MQKQRTAQAPKQHPQLITVSEAANLLSMCTRSVHRLITRQELVAVGYGAMTRVMLDSLHDYIERNRRS